MIDLYTAPTPNGWKASMALEELELPYTPRIVDLSKGEQHTSEFQSLNPNGRIPTIVDRDNGMRIFESGAILLYLAEKTGRFLPSEPRARTAVYAWLMFQMGGVGPMMGQANVFHRYFPEKIQPAIDRYQNETRRLFEVIERGLSDSEWLIGSEFTIADIANWCWVRTYKWSGVSIEGLPNLRRWLDAIRGRPGCQRGIEVPFKVKNLIKDEAAAKKFAENAQKTLQR